MVTLGEWNLPLALLALLVFGAITAICSFQVLCTNRKHRDGYGLYGHCAIARIYVKSHVFPHCQWHESFTRFSPVSPSPQAHMWRTLYLYGHGSTCMVLQLQPLPFAAVKRHSSCQESRYHQRRSPTRTHTHTRRPGIFLKDRSCCQCMYRPVRTLDTAEIRGMTLDRRVKAVCVCNQLQLTNQPTGGNGEYCRANIGYGIPKKSPLYQRAAG